MLITAEETRQNLARLDAKLIRNAWQTNEGCCPITAKLLCAGKPFVPVIGEPGDLDATIHLAAEMLGVTYNEVRSFISGFDGGEVLSADQESYESGKRLRKEML